MKTFWLSYDLGINGDFNGLYTWLDTVNAKECGSSIAVFKADFKDIQALEKDLKKFFNHQKSNRIYVIYYDNLDKKVKGKFLFGARKEAPWAGYKVMLEEPAEDF